MSDHNYGIVLFAEFVSKRTPFFRNSWGHVFGSAPQVMSGKGTLPATVAIAGTPDQPVAREVELIDLALLPERRTKWSTEAGAVQFDNLPPGRKYLMVGYDHTGAYDPVAKIVTVPTPEQA